ncbi:hypothetical protein HC891_24095 [Candidatus Gracilibacteria bacterium]|nr:hypothetical protein [Candidatus Gracilibacteria bacterium]
MFPSPSAVRSRSWKLLALVFGFALLCTVSWSIPPRTSIAQNLAANPLCPAEIPFGTLFDCSLNAVGEIDTYTFAGATNDTITFRVFRVSGNFSARLVVADPNGTTVCEVVAFGAAPLIELACNLTVNGTYSATIDDGLGTATGNYQVYAQRLNGAGNATPLAYGSITEGSLSSVIEGDTYSFSAAQNDKLVVRFVRTVGTMTGRLRIFDGFGTEVCQVVSFRAYFIVTIEPASSTKAATIISSLMMPSALRLASINSIFSGTVLLERRPSYRLARPYRISSLALLN